jgi:type II secretory pathway pseudopilin PulG
VNTKQKIPPAAQIVIAVVAILLVAAVGWFGLVHPKNAKAAQLTKGIDAANAKLLQAQTALSAAKHQKPIRVANLFRLVKAMPDAQDMSGILLQLNQVAEDTGITFESIKPGNVVPLTGYGVVPITLNFAGNFYDLSDFLLRLRTLVAVRHGELDATGRLFAVDTLGFGPGKSGFPMIEATLTVDAFVYGAAPATPLTPVVPAPTDTTATTTTETTSTSDTSAPPAGATAAGVNP